jgi:glycosyltransferase 2 family protein
MSVLRRLAAIATSLPGRILISVALLTVVAVSIDWGDVTDRLSEASWGLFALGTLLLIANISLAALRWQILLNGADLHPRLRDSARAYWIGLFSNNLLPGGFGGDAVRAWLVAPKGAPLARALTSVLVDRGTAFALLVPIAWVGVAVGAGEIPESIVVLLAVVTGASSAAALVAFVLLRRRGLGRFLPGVLRAWGFEVANTLRRYAAERERMAEVVALAVVFQLLVIASTWILSESLGLDIDPELIAVVLPLVLFATIVPISIAGFGVREGAFVALLGEAGVSSGDAVLLSLATVASVAIASLPGGVLMIVRHERIESATEIFEDAGAPGDRASLAGEPHSR